MVTPKQQKVLSFTQEFIENNGYTPTLQQIAEGINIRSASTVHQHIRELINKGYLKKSDDYGVLEVNSVSSDSLEVPVLGFIAAGSPIQVLQEELSRVTIAKPASVGDFYALQVAGDSMVEDGIFDGDFVVIKRQESAENGQTVVAIIDEDKATLKRIYRLKDRFKLQPANQQMLPIYRKEVEIRGVVWEIRRRFNEHINLNNSPRKKTGKTYKTLDLFAGIGGIRIGFERAGFKTVFANDFEDACRITYDTNFKDSKLVVEDVTKIAPRDLPQFDFLLGGFPCQAFSVAGYRHGFKDPKGRGNLFFDIARILDERKPMGFLLENVKNLRGHDGGNTFKVIMKTLEGLGYTVKSKVLNSMEYGNVPQNRERIYIVGFKDRRKAELFEFPDPVPLTTNILDILEPKVDEKYYYNNKPLYKRLKSEIKEVGEVYQWRRQYVRKNKKGVSPTLTANMGMGGHNVPIIFDGTGIRKLTPRECARIQGFPDDFKLPTNLPDSKLYKQIGNSVSVPVVERVAKQIILAAQ